MSKYINSRLRSLNAYTPGEQPRDKKYIKLNTNESPFPPSKSVIDAINKEAALSLRLYCDPEAKALKNAIAQEYGVKTENVFTANGSDDILNFAFLAFGENGVVFPDISYGFYKVFAAFHSLSYTEIPLSADFTVNVSDYLDTKKLVVIANPNAPTGIALPLSEIEKIVKSNRDSVVLIDEAYVDFGAESAVTLTEKYDNLLVVMTYSKSRSMAGARLGFAFGNKELICDLERIKYSTNPYNVNTLTQIAGTAALSDSAYYKENCKTVAENREYTAKELRELGFTLTDSKANFVFARHKRITGEKLYLALKERGILVRHFNAEKIKDFNRITVGTKSDMDSLISAIKDILKSEEKTK